MESISEITSSALQGNVLERLSGQIRENPSAIKRGIEQAIPASMAGLGSYASSENNAEELLGAIRDHKYPQMNASDVQDMVGDPIATAQLAQSSNGMLGRMFGDRQTAVVEAIAKQSGLTRSGASTVLGLAAPMVLSAVGKETEQRHLDAHGLSEFLGQEARSASSSLPGSLAGALGVGVAGAGIFGAARGMTSRAGSEPRGAVSGTTSEARAKAAELRGAISERLHRARHTTTHTTTAAMPPDTERRRGFGWKLGIIALAAIAALFLFSRRNATPSLPKVTTPELPKTTAPQVVEPKAPEPAQPAAPQQQAAPPTAQQQPATPTPGTEQPQAAPGAQQQQEQPMGAQQQAAPEAQTGQPAASPTAPSPEQPAGVAAEPLSDATGATPLSTTLDGDSTLPKRFVLEGVEFATGEVAVASSGMLDDVAATLKQHPDASVRLDGYADASGDPAQNETLATGRADAVKDYLVGKGASADQIETAGMASERPVASNDTEQGKAQNRRVELVLTAR